MNEAVLSTYIFMTLLAVATGFSIRKSTQTAILPVAVSQELKGLAILSIVFGHVGFFLATDYHFLYPFSRAFSMSVDLFLFLSGYGLTVGMLKQKLPALAFYKRRVLRIFIPLWLVLITLFVLDALLLQRFYSPFYITRSLLGWFPRANLWLDVNSVFWFISWILLAYALFPLLFSQKKPWLSALLLFALTNLLVLWNPPPIQLVTRLYQVHTAALPLGMITAWLLQTHKKIQSTLLYIKQDLAALPHYLLMAGLLAVAIFSIALLDIKQGAFQEQFTNIITVLAFVALFALKRFEIGLLYLFGVYSFEIYLLHWPIMYRYDLFYKFTPPWLATSLYLILFLILGIAMKNITGYIFNLPAPKAKTQIDKS